MKWNGLLLVGLLAASCGQGNDGPLDVKLGNGFGCVLDPGQGVYCWGANNFGQLGLTPPRVGLESGVRHSEVPVLVAGTQDARSLYLGASHACILTSNDVLCWGSDEAGQIGSSISDACEGSATHIGNYDIPCQPSVTSLGLGRQTWVSTGADVTCVGDGTSTTCRGNSKYRFSTVSNLTSLGITENSICGLDGQGKLRCDQSPSAAEYGVLATLLPIKSFVLGSGTDICAIVEGGAVQCWGNSNSVGELGAGHTNIVNPWEATTPVASAVQIVSGGGHFCALSNTGSVHCWGSSGAGQVGIAPTLATGGIEMTDPESPGVLDGLCPGGPCEPTPVLVQGIGTATHIAAGGGTSCALTESQQVKCWGDLVGTHVPTVVDGPWED